MYGLGGPKYGPWSLLDQQQPNVLNIATGTAQALGNLSDTYARNAMLRQQTDAAQQMQPGLLQAQGYNNAILGNSAALSNQTLPGLIQSTNTGNAVDAQYAPLDAAAKYNGLLASNKETNARTGLLNSQTIPQDPSGGFNAAYAAWQNAPNGSPQKQYYGGLLNKLVATNVGGYMPAATQAPQQNQGMQPSTQTNMAPPVAMNATNVAGSGTQPMPPQNTGGYTINPGSVSNKSMRGAQYSAVAPDGTVNTYSSPTTAATSQAQKRAMAHGEVDSLGQQFQNGVTPYMGRQGLINLGVDQVKSLFGDPDSTARLTNYTFAQNIKPELAGAAARFSTGGEPGIEMVRNFENGPLSNHFLTSQQVAQEALAKWLPAQTTAFNQSVTPERTGFLQNVPSTNWLGSQAQTPSLFTNTVNGSQPAAPSQAQAAAPQQATQAAAQPQMYKGYTMDEINASASKYGVTPQQMMSYIDKHGGQK